MCLHDTKLHSSRCTLLRWLVFCSFAISLELRLHRTHRVAFRCDLRAQFACFDLAFRSSSSSIVFYCNRTYAVILLTAAPVGLIVDSGSANLYGRCTLHIQRQLSGWSNHMESLRMCTALNAYPICLPKMIDMLDYLHVIVFGHMNT